MKEMILMRGVPGAGKSTMARNIALAKVSVNGSIKTTILSADDYFTIFGIYYFDPAQLHYAHLWTQWRAEQVCKDNFDLVIIDNTNTTWKEIKPYVEIAKKYEYKIDICEPGTPWKYNVDECFNRNTHKVPKETIQKMLDRWELSRDIRDKIDNI